MRKLRNILLLAATISLFTGFSAYAENYWWVNALGEWGYSAGDGNLRDGWYWIDGNRDGSAECYYFQLYSLLSGRLLSGRDHIVGIAQLQSQNARHDLRGAGHGPDRILPFPVEHPARKAVRQHRGLGV